MDEIAREGARRTLIEALEAEVDDYIERHRGERDQQGYALVVRNWQASTRKVMLGAGTVELRAPRVNDSRHDVRVIASALPAKSCRPTCGVHPKSLRYCRFYTCAGCRLVISAPPSKRSWVRTPPAYHRPISRDLLLAGIYRVSPARPERARVRLRLGGLDSFQHPAGR